VCDSAGMLSGSQRDRPRVQQIGRQRERESLDRVLEATRESRGGTMVVYGYRKARARHLAENLAAASLTLADDAGVS